MKFIKFVFALTLTGASAFAQNSASPTFMGVKLGVSISEALPKCSKHMADECWDVRVNHDLSTNYIVKNTTWKSGDVLLTVKCRTGKRMCGFEESVVSEVTAFFPFEQATTVQTALIEKYGPPIDGAVLGWEMPGTPVRILLTRQSESSSSIGYVHAWFDGPENHPDLKSVF